MELEYSSIEVENWHEIPITMEHALKVGKIGHTLCSINSKPTMALEKNVLSTLSHNRSAQDNFMSMLQFFQAPNWKSMQRNCLFSN